MCLIICIVFSSWIMFKTFHAGQTGEVYVGSNNIFDFGHAVGIIRSFSLGSNTPFSSPFQAGLPFFYHFFFLFYVAIWEYTGIPLVWAMNIPSILAFTSLLVTIYFLPQLIFGQRKVVGWIALLLSVTNPTLTWLEYLSRNGLSLKSAQSLLHIPSYLFAGPFDGSVISIFMTLNNYVNQRHLSFSLACCLLLLLWTQELAEAYKNKSLSVACIGMIIGVCFGWNYAIAFLVAGIIFLYLVLKKKVNIAIYICIYATVTAFIIFVPYLCYIKELHALLTVTAFANISNFVQTPPTWSPIQYFTENLGVLPLFIILGYIFIKKIKRQLALLFLIFFLILCLAAIPGRRGFDQKFLSFLIISMNCIAAVGIVTLFDQKKILTQFIAISALIILTISGFIDLVPIKNEFAYPLIDKKILPVISWIKKNTPKDSIFVSYADMIDPVVFAGRKNYFGFFGNLSWTDRSEYVNAIYQGDMDIIQQLHISYILVPKWKKNDFPYTIDVVKLKLLYSIAYEDDRYLVFHVRSPVVQ